MTSYWYLSKLLKMNDDKCFFCKKALRRNPFSLNTHLRSCDAYKQNQQNMNELLAMRMNSTSTGTGTNSGTITGTSTSNPMSTAEVSSNKRKFNTVAQSSIIPVDWNKNSVPFDSSSIASLRSFGEKDMATFAQMKLPHSRTRMTDDMNMISSTESHSSLLNKSTNTSVGCFVPTGISLQDQGVPRNHNIHNEFDQVHEPEEEECREVEDAINGNALLDKLKEIHPDSMKAFSPNQKAGLALISILEPAGCPKYLYDQIMAWTAKHVLNNPCSYTTLILEMRKKVGLNDIHPHRIPVDLPTGNSCLVTKFEIVPMLFSLLSDPEVTNPSNLLFGDNPFTIADESPFLNDIDSSNWFQETRDLLCAPGSKDVLCPIILFIDETHTDTKGHLTLEPVSFTIGILKRSPRMTPEAWRHLGFIPKMDKNFPKVDPKIPASDFPRWRMKDYHACLSIILGGLKDLQIQGGLNWKFGDHEVRLKFPVMFVIGDIKGHDKLTGRYGSHQCTSILRDCDCLLTNAGTVGTPCNFLKASTIKGLIDRGNNIDDLEDSSEALDELKRRSFHHGISNAFNGICFGANDRGINGATPPELLHEFKMRFPEDVVKGYLNLLGISDNTRDKTQLRAALPAMIAKSRRQSARNFPRLFNFVTTIDKGKIYTANEKYAQVFALYLYALTDFGHDVMEHCKGKTVVELKSHKKYLQLIEFTLTIYCWLYQANFDRRQARPTETGSNYSLGQEVIRKYLTLYKDLLHGQEHVKECKWPKFHSMDHFMHYLNMYGSLKNIDGGAAESNFKFNLKRPARRTQKRVSSLPLQTGNNCADMMILNRAINASNCKSDATSMSNTPSRGADEIEMSDDEDIPGDDEDVAMGDSTVPHRCSSKFEFKINPPGSLQKYSILWNPRHVPPVKMFDPDIVEKISAVLFHVTTGVEDSVVPCFTSLEHKKNIFHAHPSYRSSDPWFDFANVKWEGYDRCYPARLEMFLDLTNTQFKVDSPFHNGIYAAITSVKEVNGEHDRTAKAAQQRRGDLNLCVFWSMETTIRLVPVQTIESPAFVYWNFNDATMKTPTNVIEVKPLEQWASIHNLPMQPAGP